MKLIVALLFFVISPLILTAQILGGGVDFASAKVFDQSWLTNCPGASNMSNQAEYEPTTAMDACAPAPSSVTGTSESDVWFYFYADQTTATIQVNPSASFDIAIQALSGSVCNSLTEIGSVDAAGNNQAETLNLTGLTVGSKYYFRIFGATNNGANRVGTYTFCGTANVASTVLPVTFLSLKLISNNNERNIIWSASYENSCKKYQVEKYSENNEWETIEEIPCIGGDNNVQFYNVKIENNQVTSYYRIKQIDYDGVFVYSQIVSTKNYSEEQTFNVYPNPVKQNSQLFLMLSNTNLNFDNILKNCAIYDINGKLVFSEETESQSIFIAQLPPGIYMLKLSTNEITYYNKIIIW